jgi:hypothetical protein
MSKIHRKNYKFQQICQFIFHSGIITIGTVADILSFVKNCKGGNNLWDSNGFLYLVSKVVMAKDRSYWNCVIKKMIPALLPPQYDEQQHPHIPTGRTHIQQ